VAGSFTPEQVAEFYPMDYYTHTLSAPPDSLSLVQRALVHLAWRLDYGVPFSADEIPSGSSACDIGCGNGSAIPVLQRKCRRVVGIDPDEDALKQAVRFSPVFKGTAEDLPAEILAEKFDTVLMSHVLEHCIDPFAAAQNVRGLLSHGGVAIIEVPNNQSSCFERLGAVWPWSDVPRHLSFFTAKSLELLLSKAGFKITRTEYVGYLRQFLPVWQESQDRLAGIEGIKLPSRLRMLASTAFLPKAEKYDSIRVHASHH
jgi:2-polyprenyl-3-methyl-5-hydroxy-6-metoxy-1,4-benzoquinol methylase